MQVGVLHNAVAPDAPSAEQDVLIQVQAVCRALRALGHHPVPFPCTLDLEDARRRLTAANPEIVFNLVEALGGSDWLSFLATGLLDALGLPYTGSPTPAMMISTHKLLTKQRLCQAGLPTPAWIIAPVPSRQPATYQSPACTAKPRPAERSAHAPPLCSAFRPEASYIVKAVAEHASFGLDEHSLIDPADESDLLARLRRTTAELKRECFAEEYIDGREFNLSVLAGPDGPEVLPPAEIDFSAFPAGKPRIVGERAKWEEESFEYTNTPRRFRFAGSERPLLDRLQALARQCWFAFGLDGYARVDFRVDPSGEPWILEVNANPCLSPDAGFAAALERASISFESAVSRILDAASGRSRSTI